MTPAGTSNGLDVQNGWEENTHTHSTLIAMQGHQKNSENKNIVSTSSNMVVIIFCYIMVGCEDKAAMYMVLQYTVNRSREYIPGMIWVKD